MAAKRLILSIEEILDDRALWARLQGETGMRPFRLEPHRDLQLRELFAHNIPSLLKGLGYKPPPPGESWTEWVQGSLTRAVTNTLYPNVSIAREAEMNLRVFVWQLRRLVELRQHEKQSEGAAAKSTGWLSKLLHTLRGAIRPVVASSIAAGAAGIVTTGALGGDEAELVKSLTSFASDAGKEFFKVSVQEGALLLMSENTPVDTDLMDTHQLALKDDWLGLASSVQTLELVAPPARGDVATIIKSRLFNILIGASRRTGMPRPDLTRLAVELGALVEERPPPMKRIDECVNLIWKEIVPCL